MQWPCSSWYHVPTQKEWCDAAMNINGILKCEAWWKNDTILASMLKLPLAGRRYNNNASYYFQWVYGYYWSVSPNGNATYIMYFNNTQVDTLSYNFRAYWLSVRCLKN
jgi:uncharacterized protein (TIGR02145 family)